jgi:hypothetical protein
MEVSEAVFEDRAAAEVVRTNLQRLFWKRMRFGDRSGLQSYDFAPTEPVFNGLGIGMSVALYCIDLGGLAVSMRVPSNRMTELYMVKNRGAGRGL